jgi:hypothetical protein
MNSEMNCLSQTRKRRLNSEWKDITTLNRSWWNPTEDKLFSDSDWSLPQGMNRTNCYSTRKNWGKAHVFEDCGGFACLWINSQLESMLLGSIGSINQSQIIWLKHIDVSLLRYRDIVLCQKLEVWDYPEIHCIISKDRQRSQFFVRDHERFLLYIVVRLTFLFWVTGRFLRLPAISYMTAVSYTAGFQSREILILQKNVGRIWLGIIVGCFCRKLFWGNGWR